MSVLFETDKITKTFFGINAVNQVTIRVDEGATLGLVGQNGAGKSTLMNLIGGVVLQDSGTMRFRGQEYQPRNPADAYEAGIAFIHQELNLFTNLSIAENIFIDAFPIRKVGPIRMIDRVKLLEQTQALLANVGLEVSPNTIISEMSPGERQLVEIAKALYSDASLIIFDEPTTSLTARETERLFAIMNQLKEQGKSLIYISHILNDVLTQSDSIAVMRDGNLVVQKPTSQFDIDEMISLMVGRKLEQLYPPKTAVPQRQPLLEVSGLSARGIVKDITFQLNSGEVLGIFGLMGSGRTELARIIFGLDEFDSGEIVIQGKKVKTYSAHSSIHNKLAFVTENRREEGLLMNMSIVDNISLVSLQDFADKIIQVVNEQSVVETSRRTANALQLKSGDIRSHAAKSLSGGNQQKVVIAKWLLSEPSVFIMDEPTRGVDVGAKYEIYSIIDGLATIGRGVMFISSELEELVGMCDRILVMNQGEIVGEFSQDEFDEAHILRAAFRELTGVNAHEATV